MRGESEHTLWNKEKGSKVKGNVERIEAGKRNLRD